MIDINKYQDGFEAGLTKTAALPVVGAIAGAVGKFLAGNALRTAGAAGARTLTGVLARNAPRVAGTVARNAGKVAPKAGVVAQTSGKENMIKTLGGKAVSAAPYLMMTSSDPKPYSEPDPNSSRIERKYN